MKHNTIRCLQPTPTALAASGVDLLVSEKTATNALGVRLFRV